MGVNTSKISDEYKKEIVKLTSNNHNNIKTDQFTSEKVKPNERDTKESKMQEKSESIKDNTSGKTSEFVDGTKNEDKGKGSSNGIKSIIFGLFVLIGFIIIVYSIFIGVVGEPLASVADTVFVAAIIGSFTLVGTIVGRVFLKK